MNCTERAVNLRQIPSERISSILWLTFNLHKQNNIQGWINAELVSRAFLLWPEADVFPIWTGEYSSDVAHWNNTN
jgi:hypothetical protein